MTRSVSATNGDTAEQKAVQSAFAPTASPYSRRRPSMPVMVAFSELDLPADLDDLVDGQAEELGRAQGVAVEESEQSQAPGVHASPLRGHEGVVAEDVGEAGQAPGEGEAAGRHPREDLRDVGVPREAVPNEDPGEMRQR